MYKLLAVDLDGTLLNSFGDISEENKKWIKKAKENSIEVVLTSGRTVKSVKGIAKEVEAENYIICGNGAIVYNLKNNKILYNECIPKQKVIDLVKIFEENNIYYTLNTEKYILSKKLNYNLLYYYYENSKKSDERKTNINLVDNIDKYIKEEDIGEISKITISDENKTILERIVKKISNIKGINILEVSNMSRKIIRTGTENTEINYYYTEITKENVNKWRAIEKLANHLKIQKKEIVAIGDNINDLEMIQKAGLGIIIGESSLESKNLGKIVVKSNNLNGVAEAIEKYIIRQ